jgi:hypothetical protein
MDMNFSPAEFVVLMRAASWRPVISCANDAVMRAGGK